MNKGKILQDNFKESNVALGISKILSPATDLEMLMEVLIFKMYIIYALGTQDK
ncbi:MAG: hypothetical protein JSV96_16025 [Candidatus Aminicenantes bacterium]|nr:MAG: hypothetical protein JSV96_16025 [Candidatus Aminicenantes bacterium]